MSFDRYFIISMPTLNWIGKEAVVNHDKEVPFRLLRKVKSSSVGDNSQNLIIHGDNLEALKALMPYYVGKIKCIYIDPPYNTGNESWVYNDKENSNFKINLLERTEEQNARYKNPDNDPRGGWMTQPLHAKSGTDKTYTFTFKNGITWKPPVGTFPRYALETLKKAEEAGEIWFGNKGTAVPRLKKYLNEMKDGVIPKTIWLYDEVGSNDDGKRELKNIFSDNPFATPKPTKLLKTIIKISSGKDDIVLDSFAGSGTIGHAVLDLNKEDGGNRKFILVEMEDEIAKNITAERVKRASETNGYKGGFEYCELDKPLFDEHGQIEETCEFNQFATYIYFTETQTNIDKNKIEKNFIGEHSDTEFYLIYKEKDKNILTKSFLSKLRKTENKKIIYADKNYLDEDVLLKYNIIFKQIPYEVKVY